MARDSPPYFTQGRQITGFNKILHIKYQIEDTTIVNKEVIISVIIFGFIIFPIFFSLKGYFSSEDKKLYYSLYIYGFIKINSGYIELIKEGIALHLTNKKAIVINYKSLLGFRKNIEPLKDYHVISLKTLTEIGVKDKIFSYSCGAFIFQYIDSFIKWFLYNKKPYLEYDNRLSLFEGEEFIKFFIQTKIVFNILMILISIIKIVMEKIIYASKKRKQNKHSC